MRTHCRHGHEYAKTGRYGVDCAECKRQTSNARYRAHPEAQRRSALANYHKKQSNKTERGIYEYNYK